MQSFFASFALLRMFCPVILSEPALPLCIVILSDERSEESKDPYSFQPSLS